MSLIKKIALFSSIIFFVQAFSQDWNLKFNIEKGKGSYEIFADNKELTPMSVSFNFTLKNMESTLESNKIVVIPAQTENFSIAKFTVISPFEPYGYKYTNSYNFGDVTKKDYDEDFIYTLPFEIGKSHKAFQGYNGKFSHQKQKAIDFDFKMGEKFYAARGGKVVKIESQFDKSCATISCAKYNNQILILHSDGSYGEYLHLQKNGVKVKLGEIVEQGKYIGNSGSTGWSKGPHLHFSVYLNRMDGERFYIATKFKTTNKNPEILKEQSTYTRQE